MTSSRGPRRRRACRRPALTTRLRRHSRGSGGHTDVQAGSGRHRVLEIEIAGPGPHCPRLRDSGPRRARFIVVATGGHDVPVPHFSLDLAPPSRQLDQLGTIDRVVKLDALCYAGVDDRGNLVGHIGTMPPKLTGLPDDAAEATACRLRHDRRGGCPRQRGRRQDRTSALAEVPGPAPRQVEEWRSWNELTKGYADSYRLHLAALAERAASRWETEKLTDASAKVSTPAPRTRSGSSRRATSPSRARRPTWSAPSSIRNRSHRSWCCDRAQMSASRTPASRCTCGTPAAKNSSATSSCPTRHPRPLPSASVRSERSSDMGWNYFWAGGAGDQSRYNQFPFAAARSAADPRHGASCSAGATARPRRQLLLGRP